jgi:hypothetical protein
MDEEDVDRPPSAARKRRSIGRGALFLFRRRTMIATATALPPSRETILSSPEQPKEARRAAGEPIEIRRREEKRVRERLHDVEGRGERARELLRRGVEDIDRPRADLRLPRASPETAEGVPRTKTGEVVGDLPDGNPVQDGDDDMPAGTDEPPSRRRGAREIAVQFKDPKFAIAASNTPLPIREEPSRSSERGHGSRAGTLSGDGGRLPEGPDHSAHVDRRDAVSSWREERVDPVPQPRSRTRAPGSIHAHPLVEARAKAVGEEPVRRFVRVGWGGRSHAAARAGSPRAEPTDRGAGDPLRRSRRRKR